MAEQFDSISIEKSISVGDQNQRDARVEIKSPLDGRSNRFVANAEGNVLVGGNSANGVLILFHEGSTQADLSRATMRLNAETGLLELGFFDKGETKITIELRADESAIHVGGQGTDGTLILERKDGAPGVTFDAEHAQAVLGGDGNAGSLQIAGENTNSAIELKGDSAEIRLGGTGKPGSGRLIVTDPDGTPKITLAGHGGRVSAEEGRYREVIVIDKGGAGRIGIDGDTATMRIGFQDKAGHVILRSDKGETIHLDGERAEIQMGGTGKPGTGRLIVKDPEGTPKITLSGHGGQVSAEQGRYRELIVIDDGGAARIGIDGNTATMRIGFQDKAGHVILRSDKGETIHLDGKFGNARLGGNGVDGDLLLFSGNVTDTNDATKARIHLDGKGGNATLGGNGADGDLLLFANNVTGTDDATRARIHLDAERGNAWVGGNGADGDLALFSKNAELTGVTNPAEKTKLATIHLDGEAGDIILRNADCAEEFDVADAEHVEPGSVLVISSENELTISTQAYDKRVAGIVSRAGNYRPGILLDKQHKSNTRLAVSLMGKVYCKVDASHGPIQVGDLLTSSDRLGHAMKATDPARARGAIIGKALKPLRSGSGLIPVLVTLQ